MGDGTQEPAHVGIQAAVEKWQAYIGSKRVVATLYPRERGPGGMLDAVVELMPAAGGYGVKSVFLPPHGDVAMTMQHGRECLILLGFEPI